MSEYIGGVLLNDDDYPGEDLYSDGDIEDELLEIVRTADPGDFDRIVSERKNWPVMYHLSSVRQNILSWYPIDPDARVLEIGSGCGAVTGTLAEAAAQVTCVELSKRRSLVNAWRNRAHRNIEIRLGNFEDVEKKLSGEYDVITLIGVFEYASSYIHSDSPYEEFLRIVSSHLTKGDGKGRKPGTLLIAIENRLGLKYFAGCTEDHSGKYFDGIENYPETTYAHTFSKPELERMLDAAGFSGWEFYYPYPDYKLPLVIYSDSFLPKPGELRQNMVNYDRERLVLFDEGKAWDALIRDGLFPLFSNSFFVAAHGGIG